MLREQLSFALKERKEYLGITYTKLTEKTGLSRTIITSALNGGSGVGIDTFEKLADNLGMKFIVDYEGV